MDAADILVWGSLGFSLFTLWYSIRALRMAKRNSKRIETIVDPPVITCIFDYSNLVMDSRKHFERAVEFNKLVREVVDQKSLDLPDTTRKQGSLVIQEMEDLKLLCMEMRVDWQLKKLTGALDQPYQQLQTTIENAQKVIDNTKEILKGTRP